MRGGVVFHVDCGYGPFGFEWGEKGIGAGGDDVAQFGVRDCAEEAEYQCEVKPPEDFVGQKEGACGHGCKELGGQQAAG